MDFGNEHQRLSYPGIDAAKLVMAIVVVETHTRPLGLPGGVAGSLLVAVENVAVPFFFIASGFLRFKGLSVTDVVGRGAPKLPRVKRTALRTFRLYAIWMLAYLPVDAFGAWLNGWGSPGSPLGGREDSFWWGSRSSRGRCGTYSLLRCRSQSST